MTQVSKLIPLSTGRRADTTCIFFKLSHVFFTSKTRFFPPQWYMSSCTWRVQSFAHLIPLVIIYFLLFHLERHHSCKYTPNKYTANGSPEISSISYMHHLRRIHAINSQDIHWDYIALIQFKIRNFISVLLLCRYVYIYVYILYQHFTKLTLCWIK